MKKKKGEGGGQASGCVKEEVWVQFQMYPGRRLPLLIQFTKKIICMEVKDSIVLQTALIPGRHIQVQHKI